MTRHERTKQKSKKPHTLIMVTVLIILVGAGLYWLYAPDSEPETATTNEEASEDEPAHDIDEPSSLWYIVNKQRPLPDNYEPRDIVVPDIPLHGPRDEENMHVDSRIVDDLEQMVREAEEEGIDLVLGSGYRSAEYQETVYSDYVASSGQKAADEFSARPGHSEHQTGLAVDFVRTDGHCSFQACYEETPEGQWLREHAYRYGFILRYEEGRENITGYQYEPWHFRYVGRELAQDLHEAGHPPLESYFDLPPAPDYE